MRYAGIIAGALRAFFMRACEQRVKIDFMKKTAIAFVLPFLLTACLELTPKVSTEFSELEARAVIEKEIRLICEHKKSKMPTILAQIDASEAEPTVDHWIFEIEGMEALVFPSGIATGSYVREVKTGLCR